MARSHRQHQNQREVIELLPAPVKGTIRIIHICPTKGCGHSVEEIYLPGEPIPYSQQYECQKCGRGACMIRKMRHKLVKAYWDKAKTRWITKWEDQRI